MSDAKRWEYMHLDTGAESSGGFAPAMADHVMGELNDLGARGWEFCAFASGDGGREMILLKREKRGV